jgi:osmotically-inducible protein OsmY
MLVSISAADSAVTLEGMVDPDLRPEDATDVAGAVAGVTEVIDQVRIAGPMRGVYADA